MTTFLTILHVLVCFFLIGVVLLQRGKGAEIGAVFGGGSGATLFGSRGAGNFLTKLTTGAAVVFMLTSLTLAYFAQEGARSDLFDDDQPKQEEPASPFAEPKAEAPAGEGAQAPATGEGAQAPAAGGFEEVPPPAEAPPAEAPSTP